MVGHGWSRNILGLESDAYMHVLEFIVFVCWINIWTICVHLEFGLRCSQWVNFMVVCTLTKKLVFVVVFSHEILCSLCVCDTLTKSISWGWLSQNLFHDSDSHEIPNSHEISSWRWPLMKYHKKPSWKHRRKLGDNVIFMRVVVTDSYHENNPWRWTLMKMVFSCVYYRESWCVTMYPHVLFSWE